MRAVTRRNHEVWGAHPGFAVVYTEGVTLGPNGLANMEHPIQVLRQAGFDDAEAAFGFLMLYHYSIASLLIAPVKALDPDERTSRSDGTLQDQVRRYFGALEPDLIPNVLGVAPLLVQDSFEFGLEVILNGLQQRLADKQHRIAGTHRRRSKPIDDRPAALGRPALVRGRGSGHAGSPCSPAPACSIAAGWTGCWCRTTWCSASTSRSTAVPRWGAPPRACSRPAPTATGSNP